MQRAPDPTPPPSPTPTTEGRDPSAATPRSRGARRAAANLFIAVFLAYQVAMPLRYYLGGGDSDERFSFRMFSSVRMQTCRVSVSELVHDDARNRPLRVRHVRLARELHIAWIRLLEAGRPAVVHAFLRARCTNEDVAGARYLRRCRAASGQALPDRELVLDCSSLAWIASAERSP